MGSVTKKIENVARKGQDVYKRIDPAFGYVTGDMTGTKEGDPYFGGGGGGMSEEDSAALADRYTGKAALDNLKNQRSGEMNTLISKAMDQANGINALENAALRRNMMSSINSQNQSALRQLHAQNAAAGIRGGAAQALMAEQQNAAVGNLAQAERNLFADNIQYKQEGLKNAANIVGGQENAERDLAADKLNTILTLRGQDMALSGAEMQAQAAAAAGKKKGGKGGGK